MIDICNYFILYLVFSVFKYATKLNDDIVSQFDY